MWDYGNMIQCSQQLTFKKCNNGRKVKYWGIFITYSTLKRTVAIK